MEEFMIKGDFIELNKLLKASGICATGGQAKNLIEDGLVKVDGEPEMRKRRKITNGMVVTYGTFNIKVVTGEE